MPNHCFKNLHHRVCPDERTTNNAEQSYPDLSTADMIFAGVPFCRFSGQTLRNYDCTERGSRKCLVGWRRDIARKASQRPSPSKIRDDALARNTAPYTRNHHEAIERLMNVSGVSSTSLGLATPGDPPFARTKYGWDAIGYLRDGIAHDTKRQEQLTLE